MRELLVHAARLRMPGDGDGAPGAAVTVEMCGHWEHDPPCRVPHHTAIEAKGEGVVVARVVALAEAWEVERVRRGIHDALARGRLDDSTPATWDLLEDGPAAPTEEEMALGERLRSGAGEQPGRP